MANPEILPPIQTDAPPQPPRSTIFRGPDGIRAGWRVLMFFALMGVLAVFLFTILRFTTKGNISVSQLTPLGLGLSEGAIFLLAAIPALIMARIERRNFGQYGLPARFAFRQDFWNGALIGFLAITACLFGIFALHGFRITGMGIHGATIVSATAAWGATFVMVGLAEEFMFRGYLQFTFTTGMGFWPAAILLSALFGLAHSGNPGESKSGLVAVVLFGLLFCLFLRRTGNLWLAVGFHAGWDWGQTFFYGVPDSGIPAFHNLFNSAFNGPRWLTGGSVGPEASIFTPIVLGIIATWFSRAYRLNRYPVSGIKTQESVSRQSSVLSTDH